MTTTKKRFYHLVIISVRDFKKGATGMKTTIKELPKGEFFTLKDYGEYPAEARVYVRGEYNKSLKQYEIYKYTDVNAFRYVKGSKEVYAGFTF